MTERDPYPDSPEATRARIKLIRKSRRETQDQMATRYGVSQQLWSRYETGSLEFPTELMIRIADKEHVSLDWIYRGLPDMVRLDVAERLGLTERQASSRTRKASA